MKVDLRGRGKLIGAGAGAVAVVAIIGTALMVTAGSGAQPSSSTTASASIAPTATPSDSPLASLSSEPTDTSSPEPTGPTPLPSGWTYADLDGVAADPTLAHRLPIAVMVDDNAAARPQSGFSSASIVYQAPADGGEDRYMMIFQEGTSSDIGPVRSARPYFVQWASEYRAGYGHFGGDVTALHTTIPSLAAYIYNMDSLSGFSCAYHRVSTRVAPHNAYTNTGELLRCAAKIPYPTSYRNAPARPFVADSPTAQSLTAATVTIPYRTNTVKYAFEADVDAYVRSVAGTVQVDPANSQKVYARNIIVLYQALTYDSKVDPGHNRPVVTDIGAGQAMVFKEGQAIKATWKKTSATALTRLYDAKGQEIPLVRGEIFIQVVPIGTKATWG